jgi:hypothetical protein
MTKFGINKEWIGYFNGAYSNIAIVAIAKYTRAEFKPIFHTKSNSFLLDKDKSKGYYPWTLISMAIICLAKMVSTAAKFCIKKRKINPELTIRTVFELGV